MKTPSLNHAYRLIWSHVFNAWVAVAESAKGQGKSASRSKIMVTATAAAAALSLGLAPPALAAPTDGQVVAGAASISQAGNTTTINQSSQNLAINWQDFSIAANEAVRFNQPNSASIVLNRVIGQSNSQIFGAMSANGQVFILNPNGVLFGAGSQVNVGGLVASTLSLSNDDFLAGKYNFANNEQGLSSFGNKISSSYATKTVTGNTYVGGFSGYTDATSATIENSFYDKTVNPSLPGVSDG